MVKCVNFLILISLCVLVACSVYLENEGPVSGEPYAFYTEKDTLRFRTPRKPILIDSVDYDGQRYYPAASAFLWPANRLGNGWQAFDMTFYPSKGRNKRIRGEVMVCAAESPERIVPQNMEKINHDPHFYTQGLEFHKGELYESGGGYGKSTVNKINKSNGEVSAVFKLDDNLFAEGLTFVGDTLYLLTWKENRLLKFNNSLELKEVLQYPREGWGLCWTGRELVASDGSHKLYFLDPGSLKEIRELQVVDDQGLVGQINELEWIEGRIWANLYGHGLIAIIDPESGRVLFYIDLNAEISSQKLWSEGVVNGIAFLDGRVYLTGKNWPFYYVWRVPEELKSIKAKTENY